MLQWLIPESLCTFGLFILKTNYQRAWNQLHIALSHRLLYVLWWHPMVKSVIDVSSVAMISHPSFPLPFNQDYKKSKEMSVPIMRLRYFQKKKKKGTIIWQTRALRLRCPNALSTHPTYQLDSREKLHNFHVFQICWS